MYVPKKKKKKRNFLFFFQAKIIKNKTKETDDVFTDFYMDFCHCHKVVSMMNFM